MKKLILITCLSFIAIVSASDKYPHISSHFPTESLFRKRCEGDHVSLSDNKEQITEICGKYNSLPFLLINKMHRSMPPFLIQVIEKKSNGRPSIKVFESATSADGILAKREWIQENFLIKQNIDIFHNDLDIVLKSLNLSEQDRRKEIDLMIGYTLMSAEDE